MDNIGYMLADSSRALRRAFDEAVRRLGVTGPQARMLLTLARESGRNQGFYADRLEVEPITLCRMVDRLEDAGLVLRRRDPSDRRAWQIHLTDEAQGRVAELHACVDDMIEEALAGFSPQDRSNLARYLDAMSRNLAGRRNQPEVANG